MKAIEANIENEPVSDPKAVVPSDVPIATQDRQKCISTPGKTDPCASLDRLAGIASNPELLLEEIKRERLARR